MIPQTTDTGFVQNIESLRIPTITNADQPKQSFYLSHDNLTITLAIPCSDGKQACFSFCKLSRGEDIEESLVREILRTTKAGKKLHQTRFDDLLNQLHASYDKEGDAWLRGFKAGTVEGWVEQAQKVIIIAFVFFALGLIVGYFA